jgi:hypothetical protein
MPKTGRRYKTYTGETGITYRYFFASRRRVVRPEGQGSGRDFAFVVIADQYPPFTLRVFVSDRATVAWREAHGRNLDSNEEYAVAKMRLFRGFDEDERLREERPTLITDETNVDDLLAALELG